MTECRKNILTPNTPMLLNDMLVFSKTKIIRSNTAAANFKNSFENNEGL